MALACMTANKGGTQQGVEAAGVGGFSTGNCEWAIEKELELGLPSTVPHANYASKVTEHWNDPVRPPSTGTRVLSARVVVEGPECRRRFPREFRTKRPVMDSSLGA
ncbi:hypothetical protein Bbelb_083780 [Branchiostoma belcheri]|nr:hypothetical protein Bbelb_083780 [Branchiostoma belcheri]